MLSLRFFETLRATADISGQLINYSILTRKEKSMGKWSGGGDTGIKIRRHQIRSLGSKGNFKGCRRCSRRHRRCRLDFYCQVWWRTPLIPEHERRQRQGGYLFVQG